MGEGGARRRPARQGEEAAEGEEGGEEGEGGRTEEARCEEAAGQESNPEKAAVGWAKRLVRRSTQSEGGSVVGADLADDRAGCSVSPAREVARGRLSLWMSHPTNG